MKEFIEKLIGRLEAQPTEQFVGTYGNHELVSAVIDCCVECVNQLAEEYINCSTDTSSGWIPCSERLPEEKVYDDGYVEPSYAVLVFTKYGAYKVSRYWGNRRNKRDYYDWVDIDYQKNEVIAWMPLPPAYVPEERRE